MPRRGEARRYDDERESEEEGLDEDVELAEDERSVWVGFYSALACGHAAANKGKPIDLEQAALGADEMLREYRARCGEE